MNSTDLAHALAGIGFPNAAVGGVAVVQGLATPTPNEWGEPWTWNTEILAQNPFWDLLALYQTISAMRKIQ